ncbi:MAG: hypothetical protein A2X49_02860 [Lentisphaerae bacterium GWF2_52_8]|nr:MAG: hypothetical protein A2X49_02860 [Lentisphaerae bacterium GWF2_52_8]
MKPSAFLCLTLLSLSLLGCHAPAALEKSVKEPNPDPVSFAWIRESQEIKLLTANIYYKGIAEGQYVGEGKWTGKISGEIFCKPKPEKFLKQGLFTRNLTIQVNEDCSIKILDSIFADRISFENGEITGTGNCFEWKSQGLTIINSSKEPNK